MAPADSSGGVPDWLSACVEGDSSARRAFQETYGPDVYGFPTKIYGLDPEEAADFYVYAFEGDRIFSRLRTFEGRNQIQFRTFLSYYVLKALFLEWQRTRKELRTVSLQAPLGTSEDGGSLEDVLADPGGLDPAEASEPQAAQAGAAKILAGLSDEERLDLRLLSLVEEDLEPDEVRLLARLSGRSMRDTIALLVEVQEGLRAKDARATALRDELDSTWGWILLRENEVQQIRERLRLLGPGERDQRDRLEARRAELEASLEKRGRQRERVVQEIGSYKVTTPYKEIARLRGQTVGTVCSRLFRLRKRMAEALDAPASGEESSR